MREAETVYREALVMAEARRTDWGPKRAPGRLGPIGGLIADLHLGDPVGPEDAWKPWKRRSALEAKVRSFNLRRSGARPAANEAEEETGHVVLAGVAPNAV